MVTMPAAPVPQGHRGYSCSLFHLLPVVAVAKAVVVVVAALAAVLRALAAVELQVKLWIQQDKETEQVVQVQQVLDRRAGPVVPEEMVETAVEPQVFV